MAKRKNRSAVLLGRRGGRAKTPKQHAARKRNATKAGRPRRVCIHCGGAVVGGHVVRKQDERCGAHGWRWQQRNAPLTRAIVEREIADLQTLLASLPTERIDDDLTRLIEQGGEIVATDDGPDNNQAPDQGAPVDDPSTIP
jgi:hypothetical protein